MKAIAFIVTLLATGILMPIAGTEVDNYQGLFGDFGTIKPGTVNASTNQQSAHDVAVTSIQGPAGTISPGDVLNIDVTVQNLGAAPETFLFTLHDDSDNRDIDTIFVTLDTGQTVTIGFQWNTSNASAGPHLLTATAAAASDQNSSNNSMTISSPITVAQAGIILGDGTGQARPDASFGFNLLPTSINTQAIPQSNLFVANADASLDGMLARVAVSTQITPQQSIFVANADATFQPSANLQTPFGPGEVQGIVHLEGLLSSLGGFVKVGPEVHFLNSDGSFKFMAPSGAFDIVIQAPGHVPVLIPKAQINQGQVLTVPELTLPFGDANGDGKVDILDLSLAADNFGETTREVQASSH